MTPAFSLCHTTARLPDGWVAAACAWRERCGCPADVEYVLSVDAGGERAFDRMPDLWPFHVRKVVNHGPRSAVAGWNAAADCSTGRFLITASDDMTPPWDWDREIHRLVPDMSREAVLEVATGGDEGVLTFSLLTRPYYQRYGYLFHPEFTGMLADAWFTEIARRDGVVVDARHLLFEHAHPNYGTAETDDVYLWQHREEAWRKGREVYGRLYQEVYGYRAPPLSYGAFLYEIDERLVRMFRA